MSLLSALEAKFAEIRDSCVSEYPLPALRIGDKTAALSIVQGGMGVGISLSDLAAAVAREGGIGVIAANAIGMIEDDYYDDPTAANVRALRSEIRKARRRSAGLIGVNIMVAVDCFHELLDAAVEEKADILFLGAGLPIKGIPVHAIREAGVRVVPIVSSARAARLIFKSWEKPYGDIPDGVVVEGPRAGGHLGFKPEQIDDPDFQLERIVPEVVQALAEFEARWNRSLPVIAAGGIFTGEDIYRFLKLGAKGVQLGTRFVATDECDADVRFKQAYVACREEDIVIIESPVGLPGRAVRGPFLEAVARGDKKVFRCPSRCLESCGGREGPLLHFRGARQRPERRPRERLRLLRRQRPPGRGHRAGEAARRRAQAGLRLGRLRRRDERGGREEGGKRWRRSGRNTRRPWPACAAASGPACASMAEDNRARYQGRESPDARAAGRDQGRNTTRPRPGSASSAPSSISS